MKKLNLKTYSIAIFIGASLLLTGSAQAQFIYTIAGNGTANYNGDGIQATAAEVNQPSGVAIDKNGNVFIADNVNNRIRKIDAATGIITTVAGNGTQAYSGDGGQATAAELAQPWNVALDAVGNIYIGDRNNQRVRKVTVSTGIITTIAGNGTAGYNSDGIQATAAELDYPQGVYIDKAGNVYIADVDGARIRKVNTAGVISTVAGTGTPGYNGDGIQATAAELHNPATVSMDAAGNLYIPDYYNNEVREVNVSTGIITSVAGNGTGGFNSDGIQATASELYNPTGVTLDASGNIYITDYSNGRIREVNASTGIISTVAGDGTEGYTGDGILATSAEIYNPWDIAVTADAFYFADFNAAGNRVRKVVFASTGIEQVSNGMDVVVYPNPANQNLNIQVEGMNGKINFTLFNTVGQQVVQEYSNEKTTSLSVANLSTGIYFLKIQTPDGNVLTRKISVVRYTAFFIQQSIPH